MIIRSPALSIVNSWRGIRGKHSLLLNGHGSDSRFVLHVTISVRDTRTYACTDARGCWWCVRYACDSLIYTLIARASFHASGMHVQRLIAYNLIQRHRNLNHPPSETIDIVLYASSLLEGLFFPGDITRRGSRSLDQLHFLSPAFTFIDA